MVILPEVSAPRKTKKKKPVAVAGPLNNEEQTRMKTIKAWRYDYAKSKDIPAFLVFSNKTLDDLARKNPATLSQLDRIYGIGEHKKEAFGNELIELMQRI